MERRNRSLESLHRLRYIDSLDCEPRADALALWVEECMSDVSIDNLDLESNELNELSELFFKNINFLKQHRINLKEQIESGRKIQQFIYNK